MDGAGGVRGDRVKLDGTKKKQKRVGQPIGPLG